MTMMAVEDSDSLSFGIKFSKESLAARRTLPKRARRALADIIDQLFEDATEFLKRGRGDPADAKLRIYSQPDPALVITYEVDEARQIIAFRHVASPTLEEQKPLFISYSQKDEEWKERLLTWLAGVDKDLINVWHDGKIEPGAKWRDEIDDALRSAKAAVLLVTPNFLASEFVAEVELPALLEADREGRLKILWIAIRRSRYKETPLAGIEAMNDPDKPLFALRGDSRDSAYEKISRNIVKEIAGS